VPAGQPRNSVRASLYTLNLATGALFSARTSDFIHREIPESRA
jgi:hypothetical protein